jgi:hypothetical protein
MVGLVRADKFTNEKSAANRRFGVAALPAQAACIRLLGKFIE